MKLSASHDGHDIGEYLLAHELMHGIQHQHYPEIFEIKQNPNTPNDQRLAYQALIEGDATLVGRASYLKKMRVNWHNASMFVTNAKRQIVFREVNKAIENNEPINIGIHDFEDYFVYYLGADFVTEIKKKGGKGALDLVYKDPPLSTEQVLHPQSYIDKDLPIKIEPLPLPDGYRLICDGRVGEVEGP